MANIYRTHNCGELRATDVNKEVRLAGFVQTIRNLGKMMFIDLRDEFGITQIVISDVASIEEKIKDVTKECTVTVSGKVVERSNKNPKIATGDIEIIAEDIIVLGKCRNSLPFEINVENQNVREDLRLEYRFLDLRNDKIHQNIKLRSKIMKDFRTAMDELGFTEIQTPILANSSPEGARDFLVPSRLHPGEFYALPQAPQQFKQLLMVSGFDKYYQIAPCFRDEDPRADRSPGEFYQLDFEMSFATQEDVLNVIEKVVPSVFKKNTDYKVEDGKFLRIPYKEAMEKYGTDKPDLRNPLLIQDLTEIFEGIEFNAFKNKTVKAIAIDSSCVTRRFFDEMTDFAKSELGMKGLAWIKINEDSSVVGPIAKYLSEDVLKDMFEKTGAKENYGIFFIADEYLKACKDAGNVRIELGKRLGLIDENLYKFCFIVDFPFYEETDDGKIDFGHNPFSMPQGGLEALETKNPLEILAYQFDMVGNGYELASGAVRNHDTAIMTKAFEIAGYSEETVKNKFGALYNAFKYGAPPHAGAAPGIDRMIMVLLGETNIREIIAFPKNSKARDLLMQAPNYVTQEQLNDVHIKIDIKDKDKNKSEE